MPFRRGVAARSLTGTRATGIYASRGRAVDVGRADGGCSSPPCGASSDERDPSPPATALAGSSAVAWLLADGGRARVMRLAARRRPAFAISLGSAASAREVLARGAVGAPSELT